MRITLLTFGSRGDVQPFLALAVGLKKAGHQPTLAAPGRFADLVEQHGIRFAALPGDPDEISRRFNDAGRNPVRTIRAISDHVFAIAPQVVEAALHACQGAEMIVHGFLFTAGGHAIACQQNIPDISVQIFPMFAPTRAFANVSMARLPVGFTSYASHWVFDRVFRYGGGLGYRNLRRKHPQPDLPVRLPWPFEQKTGRKITPLVFAFSRHVIPPPPEWQSLAHLHQPGYFFLKEEGAEPPETVRQFLSAGEKPVCITFGSMINRRSARLAATLAQALQQTRQRVIWLTGWGRWDLPALPGLDVLQVEAVPHDWLFPRCRMVIHHAGAGTTAAVLRSGTPGLAIPLAGDQPFWAERVACLHAGPAPLAPERVTCSRLVEALQSVDGEAYQANAHKLAGMINREDGVGETVRFMEQTTAEWGA